MSRWLWLLPLLLLASCGLSLEVQQAIETVRQMEAQGRVTAEQARALIAGLQSAQQTDVGYVVVDVLRTIIDVACLWFFGTTLRRGRAAKRAPAA